MRKTSTVNSQRQDVVSVQVGTDLTVRVIPNSQHEFLMTSKDVSIGYGISESTLRQSKHHHQNELLDDVHFVKGVRFSHTLAIKGVQPHQIFWTKKGVIRLGFHIKSDRAKLFRDWAESIIVAKLTVPAVVLPAVNVPKKHNLVSKSNLADLLIDVCQITNEALRISILTKLTGENQIKKGGENV